MGYTKMTWKFFQGPFPGDQWINAQIDHSLERTLPSSVLTLWVMIEMNDWVIFIHRCLLLLPHTYWKACAPNYSSEMESSRREHPRSLQWWQLSPETIGMDSGHRLLKTTSATVPTDRHSGLRQASLGFHPETVKWLSLKTSSQD